MQFRDRTLLQFLAPSATNFACLFVLLLTVWYSTPVAAQTETPISHIPSAVQNGAATLLGRYPLEQKLRVVFALRPPHPQEEELFLRELQDRNSPKFHQFLPQEQWNERFAPSPENERAVIDWARSQGLIITHRYPNRTLVDAEATVATIQRAFGTNINRYQLKDQSFFSNDRDPAVPAHLAPMLHSVLGLNNLDVFHSASFRRREGSYPDYAPVLSIRLESIIRAPGTAVNSIT